MPHYRAELTGVFGDPVDDNPTGVLEEAAYAALGLNYRYLTMKVLPEDLETAIAAVKAMHFRGINLTMPHKIKVIPLLDELSEAAKIMILGAGGAARAIAVECALNGAEHIYIVNRTQVSGNELARLINEKTSCSAEFVPWTENLPVPEGTDILINATPIGFTPNQMHRPDIDYDTVREGMAAADVVFDPVDTLFLEECARHGARCFNGIGMLVQQGALNFTLWTGEEAPVDVMYEALAKEIQG